MFPHRKLRYVAVVLLASGALAGPSSAQADNLPTNAILSCTLDYAVVQSSPNGYVIGNCLNGVHIHRKRIYVESKTSAEWDGGWIYGHFSGCGWISASFDTGTSSTGTAACDPLSIGYRLTEFASYTNDGAAGAGMQAANDCNAKDGSTTDCQDGSSVVTTSVCSFWANFRPWTSGQTAVDLIVNSVHPTGTIPAGSAVKWRYVAKFPAADGSKYVMVRDTAAGTVADGIGNWGFISSSCLPSPLPYRTPAV